MDAKGFCLWYSHLYPLFSKYLPILPLWPGVNVKKNKDKSVSVYLKISKMIVRTYTWSHMQNIFKCNRTVTSATKLLRYIQIPITNGSKTFSFSCYLFGPFLFWIPHMTALGASAKILIEFSVSHSTKSMKFSNLRWSRSMAETLSQCSHRVIRVVSTLKWGLGRACKLKVLSTARHLLKQTVPAFWTTVEKYYL